MKEIESNIVTCEECFNIPKITILKKNEVQIECSKCNTKDIKDISYFDKFLNGLNDQKFIDLPKCTFDEKHESKADKYCFQCTKYLCKVCIINHNISYKGKSHFLIGQKMENQYYCKKDNHKEYIYNGYCTECKKYLCPQCKCEHKTENIYYFDDSRNKDVINEIIKKVNECEKIIEDEEKKYNNFFEELNNKIKTIKSMFNEYKERNMKIITLYKLLIKNYEQIKNIRNYNINNNIIINNDFDLSNSDDFIIKNKHDTDECFSSKFNKLCNFYANKNHIKTKQYINYSIIKKFCNKIFKKAIFVGEKKIILIFDNLNYMYYLYNNYNQYKLLKFKSLECIIKDIYPLKDNKFISIDINNNLAIWEINGIYMDKIKEFNNINFVVLDLLEKNNFFMIKKNNLELNIEYYNDSSKKISPILYMNEKRFSFKYLLEDIIEVIYNNNYMIESYDIDELKEIFLELEDKRTTSDLLIKVNNNLLKFIEEKYNVLYNELKDKMKEKINIKEKNKIFLNLNYIYMIFYKEISNKKMELMVEDAQKIIYLFNITKLCAEIRQKYIHYLVLSTKINNIYNFSNSSFLFMGEKYLFFEYKLKDKEFVPDIFFNYLSDDEKDHKNLELKYIYSNFIILNNFKKKIIYIIEYGQVYIVKNIYNYYKNIVFNDKYLLFDTIKNNSLQFSLLNLSDNSNVEKHELKEILNIKVDYNLPRLLLLNSDYKFLSLYENNQLCILDYKVVEEKKIDNDDIILRKISTIKIIDSRPKKTVKIINYSPIYDTEYGPKMLFNDNESYYCSSTGTKHYFLLDFLNEYYFLDFHITFHEDYKTCIPKTYSIQVYDEKKRQTNEIVYITDERIMDISDKQKLCEDKKINEKCRYIRFNFIDNFGGNFIIINKIGFNFKNSNDII